MDDRKLSRKVALQFVNLDQIRARLDLFVKSFGGPIDRLHLDPRSLR
jgi:hypothetical protein